MYLTAYDWVYVTECHQALNSDVLQLKLSTSDWQPKHNPWKQLFTGSVKQRWWQMFHFWFKLIFSISLHEPLFVLWRWSVLAFPLISALSVIIIVVNNAATVADLITACQWSPMLEALCSMLIIKYCRPSAQKEGYSWSICQQQWQACPWETSTVWLHVQVRDTLRSHICYFPVWVYGP